MPPRRWPQPAEVAARRYRIAHERLDRERAGRYERAGFGYRDGYRGAYADRPAYATRRIRLYPPEPEGSGWPFPVREVSAEAEERHLRALADRDLARAVDLALYNTIGPEADRVAVYATDGVITLEGRLRFPGAARAALETARAVPGVQRVRNALLVPRRTRHGGRG